MTKKNISSIEITFPFSMWNDSSSLKIYRYTIEELLKKDFIKLVHIEEDNKGTLYNTKIDGLLCSIYGLNYPSITINGIKLINDTSIYINIERSQILLKDINGNNYDIYKCIVNPPKSICMLIITIKGDIEFNYLD